MRNDLVQKIDHNITLGCLNVQTVPSELVSKLLKHFIGFMVLFDWSDTESVLVMLEEWINYTKSLADDPPIFLIGCNIDLVDPARKIELEKYLEMLKMKKIVFNHIDLPSVPNIGAEKKVNVMLKVMAQDCVTAQIAARRRSTFYQTKDPNWGFVLVD